MAIFTTEAGTGNMGRDITISFIGIDGGDDWDTSQVITFEEREVTTQVTKTLCNAHTILADLPRFWEGTVTLVRGNDKVDRYFNRLEGLWLDAQRADFTLGTIQLNITTKNENTNITYSDVSIKLDDISWKAEDVTEIRMSFRAGRRRKT